MSERKTTLAELMGSVASQAGVSGKLALSSLPKILGDAMPELPRTSVGRHRLIRSLQQRFGSNWRSLPGVKELVKEFDSEIELERKIAQIKQIKYSPKGGK